MNPQHLNYTNHNQAAAFQQEKQKWESAISNYQGPDPLELWYEYICWYEQNIQSDHERLFETILGKCLSIYESQHHYKQDARLVKLWMKYIGLKSNPLNLYQVLYQRGIGTQCAIFYIGWAHYYDSASAFKQAESVYNLGFQANAQPYSALERAHKDFRFSLSQRMLYNDQQSKKRTVSHLNDQRQQLTSLNPSSSSPNVTNFQHAQSNYASPNSANQPQQPQQQQVQVQQQPQTQPQIQPQAETQQQPLQAHVSQTQPQPQSQPQPQPQPQPAPAQLQQQQQSYQNSDPIQPYQGYNTSSESEAPPAKKFRGPNDQRTYNQSYNETVRPDSVDQTDYIQKNGIDYCNQYADTKVNGDELNNSTSTACAIASSLNSVYSGDEDGSEDYGAYTVPYNNDTTTTPEPTKYTDDTTPTATTTIAYSKVNISSADQSSHPGGCILPPNFIRCAKNHFEPWHWPIFLDEPDTNKICKYPRHLVYPGNGSEYSLEEIRARNYTKVIEAIKEHNRQREFSLNEQQQQQQHHHQQQQRQYDQMQREPRIEAEHQMSMQQRQYHEQQAYERQRTAELERERIMKERERSRLAALEMQRAKEQEEQQRRLAEQQKIQQMQQMQQMQKEHMNYHHQSPNRIQPQTTAHPHPVNNHTNYYEQNQSPVYNNYVNYPAQNHSNSSPVPYQPNSSPVPYQQNHQNSSPIHYPQTHQNRSAVPVPYQPMQQQVPQPQMPHQSMAPHQMSPHSMAQQQQYYGQNHVAPSTPIHYANPVIENQNDMYRSPPSRYPPQPMQSHHHHNAAPSMQISYQDSNYQATQYTSPPQIAQSAPYAAAHPHPHQMQAHHLPQPQHQLQQQQQSPAQSQPQPQLQPQPHPPSQMQSQHPPQNHHHQAPQYPQLQQQPQTNHSTDYQYQIHAPVPSACNSNSNYGVESYDMGPSVTETKTVNSYADDIEEQIEASTIVLKNGADKLQKITIKFRKEKMEGGESQSASPAIPKPQKPKKTKKPKSNDKNRTALDPNAETESENSTFLEHDEQYSESNDSISTPGRTKKLSKSKKTAKSTKAATKFQPSYLQDDDSCSNSDFTKLYGKYSNETNDGAQTESGRNVRFNFSGATSTPIRNNNNTQYQSPCSSAKPSYKSNESSSKSSTPRNTYKSLRRRTSNTSLLNSTLNENDDSMTSFSMVEPNSFFETETNDELHQQRLDKALKTIETHFKKFHIDPFSSELCKAFLTKADFPSREHDEFYKLTNTPLAKLQNTRSVTIGDVRYNIEKEIGRGAYGNVYRGVNVSTTDVVALKYQKPPNTWELYICFEVHQRIKDPNLLLGYMDISSAIIAPNASIFVTEFSQFGSLLDINNRIRQSTTKVMHESLVMHFTSQILNIVHYLHSCKIIHGDIKPDNFLLMKIPNPNSDVPTLRLIDFGCAIDMKFFEPNTQFKKVVQTDGFTCPEMLEGRVWSYQTDVFCVAGTVHVMLFGEYMQMVKKFTQYEIKQKLPRYLKKHIWTEFFSTFLNIKDVRHLPNLLKMKEKIDDELYGMESELQTQIRTLSNILYKR